MTSAPAATPLFAALVGSDVSRAYLACFGVAAAPALAAAAFSGRVRPAA